MATKLGEIYTDFTARTVSFEQGAQKVKSSAKDLTKELDGLSKLARRAFLGFSAAMIAREFVQATDSAKRYAGQLALVTDNSQQAAKAQADLFASAQFTRTRMEDNVQLYARMARATEEMNLGHQRTLAVTETLNKAGIVSAATSIEQSNALRQLSQGLASGTLRGEELNSVMEQMPRVAKAIADGMGITIGQLREFGKEGKITAEAVIKAIESQAAVIDKEFTQMPRTVDQAMQQLINSTERLMMQFGGVNNGFIELIDMIRQTVDGFTVMADWMNRWIAPGLMIIADGANLAANGFYQLGYAAIFNFDKVNDLALENEVRMGRMVSAWQNWGKTAQDVSNQVKNVDWGKDIFGDKSPADQAKDQQKYITALVEQEKIMRANMTASEMANDELVRANALRASGLITIEQYNAKLTEQQAILSKEALGADMTGHVEAYKAFIEETNEFNLNANRSFYSTWLAENDAALKEKLAQEQEARWKSVDIAKQEAEDKKKIDQARFQLTANAYSQFFGALASIARAGGEKNWKIYQAFALAEAIAAAIAGANKAAMAASSAGPAATFATYAAVVARLMASAYQIMTIKPGGAAPGIVGGGGASIPDTTTTQPETEATAGTDKATFIIFSGSNAPQEINESNYVQFLEWMRTESNQNGRTQFDADSSQMQLILDTVKARA